MDYPQLSTPLARRVPKYYQKRQAGTLYAPSEPDESEAPRLAPLDEGYIPGTGVPGRPNPQTGKYDLGPSQYLQVLLERGVPREQALLMLSRASGGGLKVGPSAALLGHNARMNEMGADVQNVVQGWQNQMIPRHIQGTGNVGLPGAGGYTPREMEDAIAATGRRMAIRDNPSPVNIALTDDQRMNMANAERQRNAADLDYQNRVGRMRQLSGAQLGKYYNLDEETRRQQATRQGIINMRSQPEHNSENTPILGPLTDAGGRSAAIAEYAQKMRQSVGQADLGNVTEAKNLYPGMMVGNASQTYAGKRTAQPTPQFADELAWRKQNAQQRGIQRGQDRYARIQSKEDARMATHLRMTPEQMYRNRILANYGQGGGQGGGQDDPLALLQAGFIDKSTANEMIQSKAYLQANANTNQTQRHGIDVGAETELEKERQRNAAEEYQIYEQKHALWDKARNDYLNSLDKNMPPAERSYNEQQWKQRNPEPARAGNIPALGGGQANPPPPVPAPGNFAGPTSPNPTLTTPEGQVTAPTGFVPNDPRFYKTGDTSASGYMKRLKKFAPSLNPEQQQQTVALMRSAFSPQQLEPILGEPAELDNRVRLLRPSTWDEYNQNRQYLGLQMPEYEEAPMSWLARGPKPYNKKYVRKKKKTTVGK